MGRKIELKAGGAISNCCTKNVIRQNISMSLTADVAAESKVYLNELQLIWFPLPQHQNKLLHGQQKSIKVETLSNS